MVPLYEVLCELDVPAMVHVSAVTNPSFHATGSHYLNADTTAFMQFVQADLFATFLRKVYELNARRVYPRLSLSLGTT